MKLLPVDEPNVTSVEESTRLDSIDVYYYYGSIFVVGGLCIPALFSLVLSSLSFPLPQTGSDKVSAPRVGATFLCVYVCSIDHEPSHERYNDDDQSHGAATETTTRDCCGIIIARFQGTPLAAIAFGVRFCGRARR